MRTEQLDLATAKASLEDIGMRLKLGQLSEAEADAARLALLSRSRTTSWGFGQHLQGGLQTWIVVAAVFVLVLGIGAATSYLEYPREQAGSGDAITSSGSDEDMLARLKDYAGAANTQNPAPAPAAGNLLPDVTTMIDRLATKLEKDPNNIEGWRTLGWSYFQTARYEQAAAAFARAVELDPSSTELKRSYDDAKAKTSETGNLETASTSQPKAVGGSGSDTETPAATPSPEHGAAIRTMVDGLASRLETSPRDIDGWTSLMHSRVVLGETEVAATAFRKALEVFKDDTAASGKITSAAIELGLKAE